MLQLAEALHGAGPRLAVLGDSHADLRSVCEVASLQGFITAFILSFEQRLQKPDPALCAQALAALGTRPGETLMVGDRAGSDGHAVEQAMPTLLLSRLENPGQRRLHHVLALTGLAFRP